MSQFGGGLGVVSFNYGSLLESVRRKILRVVRRLMGQKRKKYTVWKHVTFFFFSFLKYGNILNGPSASFYYIHITNHWC